MQKVLRLIARLNIGGPAHQVTWLHHDLQDGKTTDFLIYGQLDRDEGDFSANLDHLEKTWHMNGLIRPIHPLKDTLCILKVLFWLFSHRIDIVHTHTAKAGFVGRIATILYNFLSFKYGKRKVRIVHTYHGHVFSGYFSSFKTRLIIKLEKWLWSFSDRLIVLTDDLGKEITGYLGVSPGKLTTIPLGLNLKPLLGVEKQDYFNQHFKTKKSAWVGWVGRLVDIKNPILFIEIAESLLENNPDLGFVFVGDGHLKTELVELCAQKQLDENIFFYGWTDDLASIYSGIDLMMNTSHNEGTPVAVIEAQCAGVPVAATDVGGTKNVFGDSDLCWSFTSTEYSHLIMPWSVFLNQPLRLEMESRQDVAERFSRERLSSDIRHLYRTLMI